MLHEAIINLWGRIVNQTRQWARRVAAQFNQSLHAMRAAPCS